MAAKFAAHNRLFSPPYSTFTPTMSSNNSTGPNHVAQAFVFFLDLRLVPGYHYEEVDQHLQTLAKSLAREEGLKITLEVVETTPYSPIGDENAPVMRRLKKAISEQLGVKAHFSGIGGVTMASTIREAGFEAAVWSMQTAGKNKVNECYSITDQITQTQVLARALFADGNYRRGRPATTKNAVKGLTEKELAVGELLGQGMGNDEIMARLNISKNTLRTHIKSVYRKTMVKDRQDAAAFFAALSKHKAE